MRSPASISVGQPAVLGRLAEISILFSGVPSLIGGLGGCRS
jgi:hypothetical protein